MESSPSDDTRFELILNGIDCCAAVTVTIQGTNFFQSVTLQQGEMVNLAIPTSAMLYGSSISSAGVVVISSNSSISVISKVWGTAGYDWSYVYPVDLLDKEYYIITPVSDFTRNTQFAIISLDQQTSVTVTLSGGSVTLQDMSFTSENSANFSLSPYQSAQFQLPDGHLSGSFIQADKPIAVLSGHQWYIHQSTLKSFSSGNIFEQLLPISRWGRSFLVPPMSTQWGSAKILVMASQTTNLIVYYGSAVMACTEILKGVTFTQMINANALWIKTDQNVMVMFFSYGRLRASRNLLLNPFMSNVMATTMLETSQVVHAPSGFTTNLLVVPISSQKSSIVVDGISLPPSTAWNDNDLKTPKYSWVEVTVSPGSHYVQQLSNEHVWVMSYSTTGAATSAFNAGSTSSSFNFYGSGLSCNCQDPIRTPTTSENMKDTSTTSLHTTNTPTTSLNTKDTSTTSLNMKDTSTTSLNKDTSTTSLNMKDTSTTSLHTTNTPTTSLHTTDTSTTSLHTTDTSTTSLHTMDTPTTSLHTMTTSATLQKTTTTTTNLHEMTTPTTTTTVVTSLSTKSFEDGFVEIYLMDTPLSWWDALRYCRQHYTNLLSVPDERIQNLVATKIKQTGASGTRLWIGLRRHKVWGYLYWMDGQPTDYFNWGDGMPSDPVTNLCTLISLENNFTWYDQCCATHLGFICY
ncbi:IgGFc-binding protein-like [Lithobates pipiens]